MQRNFGKDKRWRILTLASCIAFYVLFILADGPVICVDSPSYIHMDVSREPFYPLYLLLFRSVFGEGMSLYGQPFYLFPAALIAGIFNGYAAWRVGVSVTDEFRKAGRRHPVFLGCFSSLMQLCVALLNRFAAKRGSMYAESILTESLAMPLYLLFCVALWQWMRYDKKRHLVMLDLCMLLLLLLRSQMLVALALFACISFLHDLLGRRRRPSRFLAAVLSCIAVYFLSVAGNYAYNDLLRGVAMNHTLGNKAFFSTAMYTATEADADLFDEEVNADERTLFLKILAACEQEELLISSSPADADWIRRIDHFSWSYDAIGFDVSMPLVSAYIDERLTLCNGGVSEEYTGAGLDFSNYLSQKEDGDYFLTSPMRALVYDEVIGVINAALMKRRPPVSLATFGANILDGLMNSVARTAPGLQLYVLIIYIVYLLLYIVAVLKKQSAVALAAEIVLGGILINIVSVSLIMYAQARYMIYSMGIFYAMLAILFFTALPVSKARRSQTTDTALPPR